MTPSTTSTPVVRGMKIAPAPTAPTQVEFHDLLRSTSRYFFLLAFICIEGVHPLVNQPNKRLKWSQLSMDSSTRQKLTRTHLDTHSSTLSVRLSCEQSRVANGLIRHSLRRIESYLDEAPHWRVRSHG